MAEVRVASAVNVQEALVNPELLPGVPGVPDVVAVAEPLPELETTVPVGVLVTEPVTLMISQSRESSSTCMINPSGFSMTKLPQYVPATLGAIRSTETSAVSPGFVTGNGTEAGALMAFSE